MSRTLIRTTSIVAVDEPNAITHGDLILNDGRCAAVGGIQTSLIQTHGYPCSIARRDDAGSEELRTSGMTTKVTLILDDPDRHPGSSDAALDR